MKYVLHAIHYDKVHIIGALDWSFADNSEFGDYERQFGLQVVSRTTQERAYKKSFFDILQYYNDRSLLVYNIHLYLIKDLKSI